MMYLKSNNNVQNLDKDYDNIIQSLIDNTTPVKVGKVIDTLSTIYSFRIGRLVNIHFFCGRSRKMTDGQEIILMSDLPLPEWIDDSIHYNINPRASSYLFFDKNSYILNSHINGITGELVIRPERTGDFGFRGSITYICRA